MVDETSTDNLISSFCGHCLNAELRVNFNLGLRFAAALSSKRFLILTGLAGSGKTNLALAFAHWISPRVSHSRKCPFVEGLEIHAARSIYTIVDVDKYGVVVGQSGERTKTILPLDLIRAWAKSIADNSFDETTKSQDIQAAVVRKGIEWSRQINSFHSPLKALALYYQSNADVGEADSGCFALVPVGADWTGNENIVGYPDGLVNANYVTKPALELIRHALEPMNALVPHFLILDEMNLSHVERYFADILSAIESNEEIPLYRGSARTADGMVVPQQLRLPDNLFIIGTVNVDETTYMFSPKVLDRANVIEFRMEPDELAAFLASPRAPKLDALDGKGAAYGKDFVESAADKKRELPASVKADYENELMLFFNLLRDHNSEFGYRVGYESARFVHFYQKLGGYPDDNQEWFTDAMDAVIVQKFLPKLHGSRSKLEGLLWALTWACGAERIDRHGKDFAAQLIEVSQAQDEVKYGPNVVWVALAAKNPHDPTKAARYPLSFDKIMRMWRKLVRDQFVNFADA